MGSSNAKPKPTPNQLRAGTLGYCPASRDERSSHYGAHYPRPDCLAWNEVETLGVLPPGIQDFAANIQTIGDRVLLLRCESTLTAWKSEAGLVAPDIAKERPQEAIVLAVGEGRRLDNGEIIPLLLKPGDRVIHSKFPGLEINFPAISDTPFIICREDECLARIR